MHESSALRMERFLRLYVIPWAATVPEEKLVAVDVGAADPGIRYKQLFTNGFEVMKDVPGWDKDRWIYKGLDLHGCINVDITVSGDPYNWPIPDNSIDLVISGQSFEHIEYPWLTIGEIARILKPGSLCCIIAPSGGIIHRHPVDCWRFLPDGFLALAKYAKLEPLVSELKWETEFCGEDAGGAADMTLIARKPKPS